MDGKSVAEIETEFSPERVFVERKNAEGIFDAEPDLRLHAENLIVLSGRPRMLGGASNPPQSTEVEEPQLLDIPAMVVNYVLERKDLVHRTSAEIVEVLERDVVTRGIYFAQGVAGGEGV